MASKKGNKDKRLYGKFTLEFPEHPKIFPLSDAAFRALVEMTLYSRKMLSDGIISKRLAHARWSLEVCQELLENDPENPSLEPLDDTHYLLHDFAEHQSTKAEIEASREKKRAAGALGGKKKAARQRAKASKGLASAKAPAKQSASKRLAEDKQTSSTTPSKIYPETETETDMFTSNEVNNCSSDDERGGSKPRNEYPTAFEDWWHLYPRKQGKRKALREWQRAIKRVTPERLNTQTELFADFHARERTEKQFIPHPTTWLNRDGWDDELISRRDTTSHPSGTRPEDWLTSTGTDDQNVVDGEVVPDWASKGELPW